MRKFLICLLILLTSISVAGAADLFDLRVFPCFADSRVSFHGTIVTSKLKENPTSRLNNFSGLLGKWLASGTVTIESAEQKINATVKDGEFSGSFKVASLASFTVSVSHLNEQIYQETFNFPEKIDFVVVSDIDDTILVTEVSSKVRLIYNSLLKKHKKREPVAGTPEFYQHMASGTPGLGIPYFVYLSSSPAFLSRPLKAFLKNNAFPQGTVILKKSLTSGEHESHKSGWLKKIVEQYPEKPLILIGDSGEKDPVIYQKFTENNDPNKLVKGIIIHQVSQKTDATEFLEKIRDELSRKNIPLITWTCIEKLKKDFLCITSTNTMPVNQADWK